MESFLKKVELPSWKGRVIPKHEENNCGEECCRNSKCQYKNPSCRSCMFYHSQEAKAIFEAWISLGRPVDNTVEA